MLDLSSLTPRQHNKLIDLGLSDPMELSQADLTRPFVYERQFGVFFVPPGYHSNSMSFLLALQHGCESGPDVAEQLGLSFSSGTADHWLQHSPGAAMRSSVGKRVLVATGRGLTPLERRLFGDFTTAF
jgi:hypothetical protein